ncbi:MAG TPA: hypothetical protein VN829_24690 [Dongiaceae bacterium]|nr:hypothetical protein [Dongiaceae bacterium]
MGVMLREFAKEVRRHDARRLIIAGHSLRAPFGGDAILHLWSKCCAATAKKLAFQSGGELCYFARK